MTLPQEGMKITGFKKEDFVPAADVLGADVRLEEMPDGVRFYIKNQKVDLGAGKRVSVSLYEILSVEGGLKIRRQFLERFSNRIPDEEEIAAKYGPNAEGYQWQAKWHNAEGKETGCMSDVILISDKWRGRSDGAAPAARSAPGGTAPAGAHSLPAPSHIGPLEILKFIQEGRDQAITDMERMAAVMKTNAPEGAAQVAEKSMEAMGRMMEKFFEANMGMMRKVQKVAAAAIDPPPPEDEEEGEGEEAPRNSGIPAWLEPFMPKIQEGIGMLLGGGPMGKLAKEAILSSEGWKAVFSDQEKWGEMVGALRSQFGEDKADKAIALLIGKGKAKGK